MKHDGLAIPAGSWHYPCPPLHLGADKLFCCDGFSASHGISDLAAETETVLFQQQWLHPAVLLQSDTLYHSSCLDLTLVSEENTASLKNTSWEMV